MYPVIVSLPPIQSPTRKSIADPVDVSSDQPLLVTAVMTGIIAIFKSYPTIGDATVWLGLLGCFPDIWDGTSYFSYSYSSRPCDDIDNVIAAFTDLRHPLLTVSLQLYSIILLPILHSLWLESGTGNANFFYAATLVYALGSGMGLVDMLGAGMRGEVGKRVVEEGLVHGEGKGKAEEEVISAKERLSRRGLIVVQYASLDDE